MEGPHRKHPNCGGLCVIRMPMDSILRHNCGQYHQQPEPDTAHLRLQGTRLCSDNRITALPSHQSPFTTNVRRKQPSPG